MGQQIGKASFEEDAVPFLNLPGPAVHAVWSQFNLSAESWGLQIVSFLETTAPLGPFLGLEPAAMQERAEKLFELLDTDGNGIVDALEFLATLAMLSALEPADKVKFVYSVYDFSESGELTVDEVTLAVKSVVDGLSKLAKLAPPSTAACESVAKLAFAANGKPIGPATGNDTKLTLAEFLAYASGNPTAASWLGYFDDIPDNAPEAPPPNKLLAAPSATKRSPQDAALMVGRPVPLPPPGASKAALAVAEKARLPPKAWYREPVVDEEWDGAERPATSGGGKSSSSSGDSAPPPPGFLDAGAPCFAAMHELLKPEERSKTVGTAPDSQLVLEWAHGVASKGLRQHVKYAADGAVLFPVAGLVVQYRFATPEGEEPEPGAPEGGGARQCFLRDHTDLITALARGPALPPSSTQGGGPEQPAPPVATLCASADSRQGAPCVVLWRASREGNRAMGCLGGAREAIRSGNNQSGSSGGCWADGCPPFVLDFSPDGSRLLSVAKAGSQHPPLVEGAVPQEAYRVVVHDVRTRRVVYLMATVPASFGAVLDAKWCCSQSPAAFAGRGGVSPELRGGSFALATTKGVVFFAPTPGGGVSYAVRRGVAGSKASVEAVSALCALEGVEAMAAGGMSGTLYRYQGRNVANAVEGHHAPITAMCFLAAKSNLAAGDGARLFTGSTDGCVKVWSALSLEALATLDLMALASSLGRQVLSLDVAPGGAKVLVATSGAEVWELSPVGTPAEGEDGEAPAARDPDDPDAEGAGAGGTPPGASLHEGGALLSGHFGGGVTCLAASPSAPEYATGGRDGTVRVFDAANKVLLRVQRLSTNDLGDDSEEKSGGGGGTVAVAGTAAVAEPTGVTALCYSPDGAQLLCGIGGGVDVLDPTNLAERVARLDGDDAGGAASGRGVPGMALLRWSPDGSLACAIDDKLNLYVFTAGSWALQRKVDFTQAPGFGEGKVATVAGLARARGSAKAAIRSTVCDLEVSDDNQWVMVGNTSLTLAWVNVETGEFAADGHRTVKAANGKFPQCGPGVARIAFEKLGAHPPKLECSDLVASHASPDAGLQLCADKFGALHLFRYPACKEPMQASTLRLAHVGALAGAAFVNGDGAVCSAGAADGAVLQWKLEADEQPDESKDVGGDEDGGGGEDEDEDGAGKVAAQDPEDDVKDSEDYASGAVLGCADQSPLFQALVTKNSTQLAALMDSATSDALEAAPGSSRAKATGLGPAAVAAASAGAYAASCHMFLQGAVPPSYPTVPPPAPPPHSLQLEWVHGASLQGSRGSVRYNAAGEIVYPAGTLCVLLNKGLDLPPGTPQPCTQKFLGGHHTNALTCLDVGPAPAKAAGGGSASEKAQLVATGQRGPAPCVVVSNASTGKVCAVLPCVTDNDPGAISCASFNADGSLVAFSACDEGAHTLHVYGATDGVLRATAPTGKNKVLGLAWCPDGSGKLLACGINHFALWFHAGPSLTRKKGIFTAAVAKQTVLCCGWLPPPLGDDNGASAPWQGVLGTQSGQLLKLDPETHRSVADVAERVHPGGVYALWCFQPFDGDDGACLASGGADGTAKLSGYDLEARATVNLKDPKYKCYRYGVKSLCVNRDGRKLLIGTQGSDVLEVTATEEAADLNDGPLVTGHSRKALTGLAAHPLVAEYATCGGDKSLRIWSLQDKRCSRKLELPGECCSCSYSPDGYILAVGMANGTVCVVSLLKPELDLVKELAPESGAAGSPVVGVKFSPNGKMLAAVTDRSQATKGGGSSGHVVFYDCENTASPGGAFTLRAKLDVGSVGESARRAAPPAVATESRPGTATGAGGAAAAATAPFTLKPTGALDFSADSQFVQVATSEGWLYGNATNGSVVGVVEGGRATEAFNEQYPDAAEQGVGFTPSDFVAAVRGGGARELKDEKWASYSGPYGWAAQGTYPPLAGPGDVPSAARSRDASLVATGDAFGGVHLFNWPSPSGADISSGVGGQQAPKRSFRAHGPGVSGCAFTARDTHLITVGGGDRCVMQFAVLGGSGEAVQRALLNEAAASSSSGGNAAAAAAGAASSSSTASMDEGDWEAQEAAEATAKAAAEELAQGAQDATTDPSALAQVYTMSAAATAAHHVTFDLPSVLATAAPASTASAGGIASQLKFVAGHDTFSGNLCMNADGASVYAVGGLGVVYQKNGHDQLLFGGHTSLTGATITALARGGSERLFGACVASGDALGGVCVWGASTATLRSALPSTFYRGESVAALALSSASRGETRGHFLVTVGNAASQGLLGLWGSAAGDWSDPALLSTTQVGPGLTTFCCWSENWPQPVDAPGAAQYDWDFATGGDDYGAADSEEGSVPQFWSVVAGMPMAIKGSYAPGLAPERCLTCGVGCGSISGGDLAVSSSKAGKSSNSGGAAGGLDLAPARLPLLACGGASGRLLLWIGTQCSKAVRAHGSAVTDVRLVSDLDMKPSAVSLRAAGTLSSGPGGSRTNSNARAGVVSGGLDGMVKVWGVAVSPAPLGSGGPEDASLALISAFDVAAECVPRPVRSAVVAVAVDAAFTKVVVLTASAELVEVVRDSRAATPLLLAHAQTRPPIPEVGGPATPSPSPSSSSSTVKSCTPCAAHPRDADLVATGGADGTVRLWSSSGRCQLACLEVGGPVSAVCWRADSAADGNGGGGYGLAVCLAPSGQVCTVTVDTRSWLLAKTQVVVPAITPVPDALVASADGTLLKVINAATAAAGTAAAPPATFPGDSEGAVQIYEVASGSIASERAAGSANWVTDTQPKGVASAASSGCLFFF